MIFGKNGVAMVGEGNHRLKTAIQLKIPKVPVIFHFRESIEKHGDVESEYTQIRDRELLRKQQKERQTAAYNRKHGIDKDREQRQERERLDREAMSPEERERAEREKEASVDELMSLFNY